MLIEQLRKSFLGNLKNKILGSPLERPARRLFLRFNSSTEGKCERYILPVLKNCLEHNSNCIDIGANRGSILEEIIAFAPDGHHYAFEPVPCNYEYLKKQYPKVNVFPIALSDSKTERQFIHVVDQSTRSGFLRSQEVNGKIEVIIVQSDTLDNILPQNYKVNFIKIDVEGAELEVLRGSEKTIRQHNPLIYFEHSTSTSSQYGTASLDVYQYLVERCDLRIWSPSKWLRKEAPLSLDEFIKTVEEGLIFNFVAQSAPGGNWG